MKALAFSVVLFGAVLLIAGSAFAEPMGKIAFQRSTFNDDPNVWANDVEIFVMDADGANKWNVTNNPARDYFGSFNPDGTRIVFTSNRDTGVRGAQEIFVMDSDGSNVDPLGVHGEYPAWSPDGELIAFSRSHITALFIMQSDGSNVRLLSHGAVGEGGYPSWSPDGTQLAFIDGHGVSVVSVDNGNPVHLADFAELRRPVWTPDGQRIVFYRHAPGDAPHVFSVDPAGRNVERYMREHDILAVSVLDFASNRLVIFDGSVGEWRSALWLMDLKTGSFRELTDDRVWLQGVTGDFRSILPNKPESPQDVSPHGKTSTFWGVIKGVD